MINQPALQILWIGVVPAEPPLPALAEISPFDFVLTCAGSLEEATQLLCEGRFAAVLLDIGSSAHQGIDKGVDKGLEALAQIQQQHPSLPIIILSGTEDEALAVRALQSGAQDYLDKSSLSAPLLARSLRFAIERKRSEQQFRDSATGYRRLFETAHDGIFILDAETGQITAANPHLKELLGFEVHKFIGKRLWEIAPFRDRTANQAAFRTLQEKGLIRYDDLTLLARDGRQLNVEFTSNVYEVGSKRVIQCNIRDITDHKRAVAQLLASEARFRTMIQSSWDVFHLVNPDGTIIYESPAVTRVLGYLPAEMEGHNVAEFVHPEDLAKIMEASFLEPHLPGIFRTSILRILHKNGSWRWVESFEVNLLENPDVGAIAVNYRDITDRRKAEAQRDRFFTLSLDILGIAGLDGYFKRVNPAFLEILGYTEAEMLSRPLIDFVHPDDHAATNATTAMQAAGEPLLRFENRYRTKSGQWRWFEWKGVTVLEEGLIYAAARDVTERRESEAILRGMRDELEIRVQERTLELARSRDESTLRQTILEAQGEASIDGILIVDPAGKIVSFNRRFMEMWGIPEAVMAEKSDTSALDAVETKLCDPHAFRIEVAHLYNNPEERSQEEILLLDERTFDRYSAPVKGKDGTNQGRIWFFRDVTERKQFEESIHHAREEAELARESAETANHAKSEFLSRMSHELRTPLNAILGFGQILDQQELGPLERESVDYILKGGRHLLGLINEILDIARVEAGHIDLSLEPIAIAEMVAECCALVRPLAEQNYIRIVNEAVGTSHVLADHQRLKQVLINLLSNAIKYNRTAGSVTISVAAARGETIQIRIRDSGMGLTPAEVKKLFVPFERLDAGNLQIEGTGLGLVLSQQLAQAMNGVLGVESIVGEGSTFWIELPAVRHPTAQMPVPSLVPTLRRPLGVEGRSYTVLSIEDNLSNVRLLEVILGAYPEVALMIAMQGSIGLELARQHAPDVILLDLHMPGISGHEVLQQLKQSDQTRSIPVVIVSADATPQQIDRLLETGAAAFLTKPIDMGILLNHLDMIFQSK